MRQEKCPRIRVLSNPGCLHLEDHIAVGLFAIGARTIRKNVHFLDIARRADEERRTALLSGYSALPQPEYISRQKKAKTGPNCCLITRAALSTPGAQKQIEANSYVQPSVFDMLAGASPASAMDGWAE